MQEKTNINISSELKEKIKYAFDRIDLDGKGTVSSGEILETMNNFGYKITEDEVKDMLIVLDIDHSGEIEFDEFLTFIVSMMNQQELLAKKQEEVNKVVEAFKKFDKDGNGYLSVDEFKFILSNLGKKFTDQEVMEIFNEVDINHDGNVDYLEFVNFWNDI